MAEDREPGILRLIQSHSASARAVLDAPEVNVVIFALLLNYPWEFLQAPLYRGMATAPHWLAVQRCTAATIGDAVLMLFAYLAIALCSRRRWWALRPTSLQSCVFVLVGAGVTVAVERWATSGVAWGWRYTQYMPVVPGFGVGLSPLVEWILIPPLVLWFVRRQLSGRPGPPRCDPA